MLHCTKVKLKWSVTSRSKRGNILSYSLTPNLSYSLVTFLETCDSVKIGGALLYSVVIVNICPLSNYLVIKIIKLFDENC